MRWGSFFFTLSLATSATMVPRLFGPALDPQKLAAVLAPAGMPAGTLDPALEKQLAALQEGQTEAVPLQTLAALQDLAGQGTLGPQAEVAGALINAFRKQKPLHAEFRDGLLRDSEHLRQLYREARPKVLLALLALGLLTFVVAVLGALPFFRGLARFHMTLLFALSGRWLMLVSLACVAYFLCARLNPWPLLPQETLAAPVAYMLLTSLFVRLLDPNFPLWNSMLKSMASPILGCLAVAGFEPGVWKGLASIRWQEFATRIPASVRP